MRDAESPTRSCWSIPSATAPTPPADISRIANIMPPLGLASIAAYLEQRGIRADIVDCYARPDSDRAIRDYLLAEQPAFIGLSCTTSSFLDGIRIAELARAALPGIQTVFGGPHVSALKEELFPRFPAMDFAVIGEGEETMAELIASGGEDDPATIKGIVYRKTGKGRPASPATGTGSWNWTTLPFPAYEKLDGFPDSYMLPIFNYPQGAQHQLHLQPRLPLRLQLLRPLRLPPQLPLQLRRVPLRAPALPEGTLRHPAHQLLRRPVHLQPDSGSRSSPG